MLESICKAKGLGASISSALGRDFSHVKKLHRPFALAWHHSRQLSCVQNATFASHYILTIRASGSSCSWARSAFILSAPTSNPFALGAIPI